jgi:hypothetical protein
LLLPINFIINKSRFECPCGIPFLFCSHISEPSLSWSFPFPSV